MPTLLDKIKANAAQALQLPEGRRPSEELDRYKSFLKVETQRLKILHRSGENGREVCAGRAQMMDVLLQSILQSVEAGLAEARPPRQTQWALAAIGGYGRSELNPHSDIDIMFLHDGSLVSRGKPLPFFSQLTDGLLYTLWDVGLKVGHSVRSPNDCVTVANEDMQSKTSLIESRLITGSKPLFEQFQKLLLQKCVKGHEDKYIAARIEDQRARREKFGNSFSLQEPNIKNCCGGLRDYQNLLWMSFFKYRTRSLRDLIVKGLVSQRERKLLRRAYDYLLRVRNELHYQVNRPVDVLSRNLQPSIAHELGIQDPSPMTRIEEFMRELYIHLRNIFLITRTIEQRLALLPQPRRFPTFKEILQARREKAVEQRLDGFRLVDGEIHLGSPRMFDEQPRRMMRLFLHAQKRGLTIHPDLEKHVRDRLSLVDRGFLNDEHVRETFLEILNEGGNVAPILRRMHEIGFLGKYIPEFGKLTCLVQHDFYHRYTADEHTLVCLEMLDKIWDSKEQPFEYYSEVMQDLDRPYVLYLALLLHDSGKAAKTGDHSTASCRNAERVAKRLRLSKGNRDSLILLIREHLTMVQISQTRDIEDPKVVNDFAGLAQNIDNARMLTLHSFADSMGTGGQLWNGFKDSLLRSLYTKTVKLLSGDTAFYRMDRALKSEMKQDVRKMVPSSFSEDEIDAHFELLPNRYFRMHSSRQVGNDLAMAHRFMHLQEKGDFTSLRPIVTWQNEPDRGYSAVHVCTWDRPKLFSQIAGSLTASGLSITGAQIFTRKDGIIFDTFFVMDSDTGKLATRKSKEQFEETLGKALKEEIQLSDLIHPRREFSVPYELHEKDRIGTEIVFDNETSDRFTIIDILTEDRVGLLYFLSKAFIDLNLDVALAKISTGKGEAADSFYVRGPGKSKILDPEQQRAIEEAIREAIGEARN